MKDNDEMGCDDLRPTDHVALEFAQRLLGATLDFIGSIELPLTEKWARDPPVIAIALLCRTTMNFRAAMLLAQSRHVIEARMLVRCCYENLLWIGALHQCGSEFVQEMLSDEAANRKALAQLVLKHANKDGAGEDEPAQQLRELLRQQAETYKKPRKLHANETAEKGIVGMAYIEFGRLSLDAVHPSITALGRHVHQEARSDGIGLRVDVHPDPQNDELRKTVLHACSALIGVVVATSEMTGETRGMALITSLADELLRLGHR